MEMTPLATVLIVTRNRQEDLRRALRSVVSQSAPLEVLVIDDASTDGTAEMVRSGFPQVTLEMRREPRGYIVGRNEGTRLANAPIIFSIDDDAEFSTAHTVEQTLAEFDDKRIGAVAIPFVNVLQSPDVHQLAPNKASRWLRAEYVGTAHAVRRNLFLNLGGYNEHLVHQGEERDFCIRLLNAGFVVRLGTADPIFHYESPRRDFTRMDYYGRRNDVLFAWQNVPMPYLPVHLAATIAKGSIYALRRARHPARMFAGLFDGLVEIVKRKVVRNPVSRASYRRYRRLRTGPMLPLGKIEAELDCRGSLR